MPSGIYEHRKGAIPWNKGKKYSETERKKMSEVAKKHGVGKWMLGKKHSAKTIEKLKGRVSRNKGKEIHSEDTKKLIGLISKKNWSDPVYKEKMLKRKRRSYTVEDREKRKNRFLGKVNPLWKEKPGYGALHDWVRRYNGKAKQCALCLNTKNVQWANKDHKYQRVLSDFISLCAKCHHKYDREHNGKKNRWENNRKQQT